MAHKNYLLIIAVAALMGWVAFLTVVMKFNPYESSLSIAFFFFSLFISLSCTFALLGYFFRLWLYRNEVFYIHINIALRQGIMLGLVAIGCFVLLMLDVLNWWSGSLLILASVLLEFYFDSKEEF